MNIEQTEQQLPTTAQTSSTGRRDWIKPKAKCDDVATVTLNGRTRLNFNDFNTCAS